MKQNSVSSIKYLDEDELSSLKKSIKDARDAFIIEVLYETGCELNEVINIKVKNINFDKNTISFDGQNKRKSIISEKLSNNLYNYIIGNLIQKEEYIFSTRQSGQISTKRIQQLINGYSKKAGLGKINPHIIRYTHIAHAFKNGMQHITISNQIGLTSYRVFQIIDELKIIPKKMRYKII